MSAYEVYWYRLTSHANPHKTGYVGVTKQATIRQRCHKNGLKGGSVVLFKAYEKYGEAAIIREVLHTVDTAEEAYELEMAYRPHPKIGWNIAVGGGLPPDTTGRIDSPEVRKKRAESVRKAKAGKTYPSVFKGMTNRHSEEQRIAIGNTHRGKTISEAHKQAITEKMSGADSPKAKEIILVHKDTPEKVHRFPCIKTAADSLCIPYNTLRSQAQRSLRSGESSEPSRLGWICMSSEDAENSIDAVRKIIALRLSRFNKMTQERESNKLKVLG